MTCPTCNSNCTEFCGSMVQQRCNSCGSWWSPNTGEVLFVPERSKPVEVLELPDAPGRWYQKQRDGTWDYIHVAEVISGLVGYKVGLNGAERVSRGQYVRATPPIVQPPVRDASPLKLVADQIRSDLAKCRQPHEYRAALMDAMDLADRLEHETKGAERE